MRAGKASPVPTVGAAILSVDVIKCQGKFCKKTAELKIHTSLTGTTKPVALQ
jgi:hypothetical protein